MINEYIITGKNPETFETIERKILSTNEIDAKSKFREICFFQHRNKEFNITNIAINFNVI